MSMPTFFEVKRRISIQTEKEPIPTLVNLAEIKVVTRDMKDGTAIIWLAGRPR